MENRFTKEIYDKLLKAVDSLPDTAVERAKKEITRKGYDTTGYQYQFLVNILNEIVGVNNWSYDYIVSKENEGNYTNGKHFYEVSVDMEIEILGAKRKAPGGHKSEMYADAKKGAVTNSLKKTLAMFGIGKKAYEGTIDDDFRPLPDDGVKPKSFPVYIPAANRLPTRKTEKIVVPDKEDGSPF
jgi:hypothetical protein